MLNLVVALAAESRPLIQFFGLKQWDEVRGFRVYAGDNLRLIVTGVGRVNAAAGVACLGTADFENRATAWLNVGIAGHNTLDIGTGVYGVRLVESATGRRWFPPQVAAMPGQAATIRTVDEPESAYPDHDVVEMEATAFFATALRYASGELIQCYKIISDNSRRRADQVDKHLIRELISAHLQTLCEISKNLTALASSCPRIPEPQTEHFFQRWHFTVSQKNQLKELLKQWAAVTGGRQLWNEDLNRCPSAKAVLFEIRSLLDQQPVEISDPSID